MSLSSMYTTPEPTELQRRRRRLLHRLLNDFDFPATHRHDFSWLLRHLWRKEHNRKHRHYRAVMWLLRSDLV